MESSRMIDQIKTLLRLVSASVFMLGSMNVFAEVYTVNAEGVRFSPAVLVIEPGDSVQWKNMSVHSVEAVDDYLPEGTAKWGADIGKDFEMTFTQEGIYIYRCKPHHRLAMTGAIIVGIPTNLEQLKSKNPDSYLVEVIKEAIAGGEAQIQPE
jgi:pseudoazurin